MAELTEEGIVIKPIKKSFDLEEKIEKSWQEYLDGKYYTYEEVIARHDL